MIRTLVATSTRCHGGVEARFVEKAPAAATETRAAVEHLDIADREAFWFRGGHSCRLCSVVHATPREHFTTGVEARQHVVREIFLDYWIAEDRAGRFSGTALWHKRLAAKRVDGLRATGASPAALDSAAAVAAIIGVPAPDAHGADRGAVVGGGDEGAWVPSALRARCAFMYQVFAFLRAVGVLGPSLCPARRGASDTARYTKSVRNTVRFEALEYTGDCLWGFAASARLMWLLPHRNWLTVQHAWAWSIVTDGVESNDNLVRVATLIGVERLLDDDVILGGGKPLADVLEAVTGEMHARLFALTSHAGALPPGCAPGHALSGTAPMSVADAALAAVLRFALAELNDLCTLVFAHHHVGADHRRLVGFARELLATGAILPTEPALAPVKTPRPFGRRLRRATPTPAAASGIAGTSAHREFTFILHALGEQQCAPADASVVDRKRDPLRSSRLMRADVDASGGARGFGRRPVDAAAARGAFERFAAALSGAGEHEPAARPAVVASLADQHRLRVAAASGRGAVDFFAGATSRWSCVAGGDDSHAPLAHPLPLSDALAEAKPVDAARVFPTFSSFELNTGHIPQIVLDVEARRAATLAQRKGMRRNRRI
jgi:hypothetical protein